MNAQIEQIEFPMVAELGPQYRLREAALMGQIYVHDRHGAVVGGRSLVTGHVWTVAGHPPLTPAVLEVLIEGGDQ